MSNTGNEESEQSSTDYDTEQTTPKGKPAEPAKPFSDQYPPDLELVVDHIKHIDPSKLPTIPSTEDEE